MQAGGKHADTQALMQRLECDTRAFCKPCASNVIEKSKAGGVDGGRRMSCAAPLDESVSCMDVVMEKVGPDCVSKYIMV